ncbi:MAG: hypothetical protein GF307_00315 [candidate division Zixibacteria bacterium]|nr:hypothetical protein [candidate division Zixibacteria bacterium]
MKSFLYITENKEIAESIEKILKGKASIDFAGIEDISGVHNYDLIIYDWMPDTLESLTHVINLRANCKFKDIPIIISIEKEDLPEARKSLVSGGTNVIYKPFEPEKVMATLDHALKPIGSNARMDANLVNTFIQATKEVLKTTTKSDVVQTELYLKKDYYLFGDFSGVMAIEGEADGSVSVTFNMDLALKFVSAIIGVSDDELSVADIQDGVGEIINQIAGKAREILWEKDYKFNIATPSITAGYGHKVSHIITPDRHLPIMTIVFECCGEPLALQLCMTTGKAQTKNQDSNDVKKLKAPNLSVDF